MEILDSPQQLIALVGNEDPWQGGKQTVLVLCTPGEIEKAIDVICESYPSTQAIREYDLLLGKKEKAFYFRGDDGRLHKV